VSEQEENGEPRGISTGDALLVVGIGVILAVGGGGAVRGSGVGGEPRCGSQPARRSTAVEVVRRSPLVIRSGSTSRAELVGARLISFAAISSRFFEVARAAAAVKVSASSMSRC
jgi:hypothetical protein